MIILLITQNYWLQQEHQRINNLASSLSFLIVLQILQQLSLIKYYFHLIIGNSLFQTNFEIKQLLINKMQGKLNDKQISQIITQYEQLTSLQRRDFKQFLSHAHIHKLKKGAVLLREGQQHGEGYLILQGTVALYKKLNKREDNQQNYYNINAIDDSAVVLAEVTFPQILNIQSALDTAEEVYFAKYTATVSSREAKYIKISQYFIEILLRLMQVPLRQLQKSRNRKLSKIQKMQQKKKEEQQNVKLLGKMSLPQIKIPRRSRSTPKMKTINAKDFGPEKKGGNQYFDLNPLEMKQSVTLQKNDKNSRSRQGSLQLYQQNPLQRSTQLDRHEIIFKEKLKSIIKRKIVYQRKQLAVLKAYKKHQEEAKIIHEEHRNMASPQANQIDVYFKY